MTPNLPLHVEPDSAHPEAQAEQPTPSIDDLDQPSQESEGGINMQCVAEIRDALAQMDAAIQSGEKGMTVEEAFAELTRRRVKRLTSLPRPGGSG